MKTVFIELTYEEYDMILKVVEKLKEAWQPKQKKPSKWIKENGYLINTKTGRKLDIATKKFVN